MWWNVCSDPQVRETGLMKLLSRESFWLVQSANNKGMK